jgi:hypothetical protein
VPLILLQATAAAAAATIIGRCHPNLKRPVCFSAALIEIMSQLDERETLLSNGELELNEKTIEIHAREAELHEKREELIAFESQLSRREIQLEESRATHEREHLARKRRLDVFYKAAYGLLQEGTSAIKTFNDREEKLYFQNTGRSCILFIQFPCIGVNKTIILPILEGC